MSNGKRNIWVLVLFLSSVAVGWYVLHVNDAVPFKTEKKTPGITVVVTDACNGLTSVSTRVDLTRADGPSFRLALKGPRPGGATSKTEVAGDCAQGKVSVQIRVADIILPLHHDGHYPGTLSDGKLLETMVRAGKMPQIDRDLSFSIELPIIEKEVRFDLPHNAIETGYGALSLRTLLQVTTGNCIKAAKEGTTTEANCRLPTHVTYEYSGDTYALESALPDTFEIGTGAGTIVTWGPRLALSTSNQPGVLAGAEVRFREREAIAWTRIATIVGSALFGAGVSGLIGLFFVTTTKAVSGSLDEKLQTLADTVGSLQQDVRGLSKKQESLEERETKVTAREKAVTLRETTLNGEKPKAAAAQETETDKQ